MKTITYNPETHVLVPLMPDEKMIEAGDSIRHGRIKTSIIYMHMLAAAPQPEPNPNWCAGCSPDNCSCCGAAPVDSKWQPVESEHVVWMNTNGAFNHMKKAEQDALHVEAMSKLTEMIRTAQKPQPDRTAELEAALKVAREGIDKFLVAKNSTEFDCACDLSVGYLCGPCHADKQQQQLLESALAKINGVLK